MPIDYDKAVLRTALQKLVDAIGPLKVEGVQLIRVDPTLKAAIKYATIVMNNTVG